MARSYQDLLAKAREQVPEVQVADLAARREAGDSPLVIDVREQAEWDEGHIPGSVLIPRGHPREPHRRRRRPGPGDRAELRLRQPVAAGRHHPPRDGLRERVEPGRRLPALEAERPALGRAPARSRPNSARATAATSSSPRWASRASSSCSDSQGAAHRRRRPRLARRLLPGRRRRGHHRPGRRRRGGREQPPAPDHPHHRPRRDAQGRVGEDRDRGAQPRRHGQRAPVPGGQGERARPDRRLRRDHRRRRQLPDALPAQRRRAHDPRPRSSTRASCASRATPRSSCPTRAPATAASSRSRRRPTWRPPAARPACSASSAA